MKNISYLILGLLILSGCANSNQRASENVALIKKYINAVEAKDYGTMEAMLAEGYEGFGPSVDDSTNRDAALQAWKYNVENLYESIVYERSRNIAVTVTEGDNQGDWVSNWALLSISFKDGRGPVKLLTNTTYQIANGKILKSYTFYNEADALEQLGYVFINPQDL